jgi:hypothetical protein
MLYQKPKFTEPEDDNEFDDDDDSFTPIGWDIDDIDDRD